MWPSSALRALQQDDRGGRYELHLEHSLLLVLGRLNGITALSLFSPRCAWSFPHRGWRGRHRRTGDHHVLATIGDLRGLLARHCELPTMPARLQRLIIIFGPSANMSGGTQPSRDEVPWARPSAITCTLRPSLVPELTGRVISVSPCTGLADHRDARLRQAVPKRITAYKSSLSRTALPDQATASAGDLG